MWRINLPKVTFLHDKIVTELLQNSILEVPYLKIVYSWVLLIDFQGDHSNKRGHSLNSRFSHFHNQIAPHFFQLCHSSTFSQFESLQKIFSMVFFSGRRRKKVFSFWVLLFSSLLVDRQLLPWEQRCHFGWIFSGNKIHTFQNFFRLPKQEKSVSFWHWS